MQLEVTSHKATRTLVEQVSWDLKALDHLLEKVQTICSASVLENDKEAENLALQQLTAHEIDLLAKYLEDPEEISEDELVKGWLYSHRYIYGTWTGRLYEGPTLTSINLSINEGDEWAYVIFDRSWSYDTTISGGQEKPIKFDFDFLTNAIRSYLNSHDHEEW